MNTIDQHFNQPSFVTYATMEAFLIKVLKSEDYSTKLQFLETNYANDVVSGTLKAQLEIFKILMKDYDITCFNDILDKIKELQAPQRRMVNEIVTICKLLLVNPATGAARERSFSVARRIKTWLRSTMSQDRFSNLTVLNTHKERTDKLYLANVANEFVSRNDNLKRNFGTFNSISQHSANISSNIVTVPSTK